MLPETFRVSFEESGIPLEIRSAWQKDVGEEADCRHDTACVTNCLIIDQSEVSFLKKWASQMDKVCDPNTAVQDRANRLYSLSDEDVLASLLCFSSETPPLVDYPLNLHADCHLVHLIGRPKPWEGWTPLSLQYRSTFLSIMQWAQQQGYELGPVPSPFRKKSAFAAYMQAYVGYGINKCARLGSKIFSSKPT